MTPELSDAIAFLLFSVILFCGIVTQYHYSRSN